MVACGEKGSDYSYRHAPADKAALIEAIDAEIDAYGDTADLKYIDVS